jgi:hypothetical protein
MQSATGFFIASAARNRSGAKPIKRIIAMINAAKVLNRVMLRLPCENSFGES